MASKGAAAVSVIMSSSSMADFVDLLRTNRNYRCTWLGQVVSEIGDYFNNIAVFSLVTQTTQWATLTAGTMLAGWSADKLGYQWAFIINSLSFVFSAAAIWLLDAAGGSFRAQRQASPTGGVVRPWHEYREGLQYIRSTPLILGIGLLSVGWAAGGGAAQILFTLFGEQVFKRGPAGI